MTYLGIDLRGPLQNALDAHIRGRAAKDATQPCRRRKHQQRLDRVGTDENDAVSLLDAPCFQSCCQTACVTTELAPGEVAYITAVTFTDLGDGNFVVFLTLGAVVVSRIGRTSREEEVLGPIETHPGEPLGNGVYRERFVHNRRWTPFVDQIGVVKEMAVKCGAVGDCPVVEVIEGLKSCKRTD